MARRLLYSGTSLLWGAAMKLFKRVSITMAAGLILVCGHAAHAIGYAGGSLIIPTQASYQDYCGVASAYGLVYNVLRANDGLAAAGKSRTTVHWGYKSTKASPNRCVPTDAGVSGQPPRPYAGNARPPCNA